VSPEFENGESAWAALLGPLREEPARAAILTDVDGTLAPIVERAEDAAVPAAARAALAALSERFALVGCVSGRQAEEARRLVGLDGVAYAGNHGLELLLPGEQEVRADPSLDGREHDAAGFMAGVDAGALATAGLRHEDKGAIQALHWRGAADEASAEGRAHEIAIAAGKAGLNPHWGRKVLELRPAGGGGKDAAVASLRRRAARPRRLRRRRSHRPRRFPPPHRAAPGRRAGGRGPGRRPLSRGPARAARRVRPHGRRAGGLVGDPRMAGGLAPVPYTDLLRVTVFITGAEATVLGAVTAIGANREGSATTILVAAAWWLISLIVGFYLGRPSRAVEDMRNPLARARTATSLPPQTPARITIGRLWPIAATAILAGGLGLFFPGVAVIGAGYALIVSLAWHTREAAVLAIEQRDGVKFYVVPNSALRPVELVRTPGLRSDRLHAL
jgi:trehalose 6-phosphate phosphatase